MTGIFLVMAGLLLVSITSGQVIARTGRYRVFPIVGTGLMTIGLFLLLQGLVFVVPWWGNTWGQAFDSPVRSWKPVQIPGANYAVSYATASGSITAATLTVTASGQSKTYGQSLAFGSGSTSFTSSGLQNGDTIGSVTLAVNRR